MNSYKRENLEWTYSLRYDLSLVSNMSKLPVELRRLVATRQRAKLRVEAEGGR